MSILDRYPVATAAELIGALRARKVSAVELTQAAISRIEALDGPINAVVVRDFDRARQAAKAADAALAAGTGGPLTGLPITVKESYDIVGHPTCWGAPDAVGHRAPADAVAVERLRSAGAIILGKTNVPPSLADWQSNNPVYGRTNNPYDVSRSPGGSSGGSAAALAMGYVALEMGSDIGGSIRVPAAFCGVFGHKPSLGIIPSEGHTFAGAQVATPLLSVRGPLARSAADLRLAMEIIAGPAPDDAVAWRLNLPEPRHAKLSDYRVLVLDQHPSAAIDSEVLAALNATAAKLEAAGAKVTRDASILPDLARMHRSYMVMLQTSMSRRNPGERSPISAHEWLDALDGQYLLRAAWAQAFQEVDIVLAPTFSTAAFPHTEEPDWRKRSLTINGAPEPYGDQLVWAGLATITNLPSTAFPAGMTRDSLPIGLQAIGPYLEDFTTIAFAGLAANDFVPPKV